MSRIHKANLSGPVLSLALCSSIVPSAATGGDFEGKRIIAEWRVPTFNEVFYAQAATVGAGTEINRPFGNGYNIDIEGAFIQFDIVQPKGINFSGGGNFNGWSFADSNDSLMAIEGYEIDSASAGVTGLDRVETGFDIGSVWADFDGVNIPKAGGFIRMKVLFGIFEDGFELSAQ